MEKMKSLLRICVLLSLGLGALVCIMSEPLDDSATWVWDLVISKGLGLLLLLAVYRLYGKWSRTDAWLRRYDEETGDEADNPNPMQL